MIQFKPAHIKQKLTVKNLAENFPAMAEETIAEKLNKLSYKMPKCKVHPTTFTVVTVRMDQSARKLAFESLSWCCDEFQENVKEFIKQEAP